MSWMSPLDAEREKLEGVLLNVCNDCKDMVVQVNYFVFSQSWNGCNFMISMQVHLQIRLIESLGEVCLEPATFH